MAAQKPQIGLAYLARNLFQSWQPAQTIETAPELSLEEIDVRLRAAYRWLKQAFQATGGKGFSKGFSHLSGWMPAYPETSGYIISSLLKYGRAFGDEEAVGMAKSTAGWLYSRQNADGGIPAIGKPGSPSLVFDTGMVLHGLVDLYNETGDEEAADHARQCAEYLSKTIQDDGSWPNCYHNIPHAYHARVSWPLLYYAETFKDAAAFEAAEKNFAWVLDRQNEEGYWEQAYFTIRIPHANTHSLGYILEGLIEAYLISGNVEWLHSARKAADRLAALAFEKDGFLPGYFDASWEEVMVAPVSFACLTGIAQISRAWLLLHRISTERKYLEAANLGLHYVLQFQDIHTRLDGINGALPGSAPIYGGYLPFQYPNWAVKFLMDLLFEKRKRLLHL